MKFEFNLEDNLVTLRDELLSRTYKPQPSNCFIIHDPKMREVFAANFRDRIVHHLFYNYTHHLFERSFIYDSYSCIKGRGTHFGINRLKHHIRSVSAASLKRMKNRIKSVPLNDVKYLRAAINSYLAVFSHCRSFCLRRLLFSYLSIHGRKCFSANWLIFNIEANNK